MLFGTLLANRPRADVEPMIGFFANTLPLRLRLDGDPTVGELVRRAHAAALGAQEHPSLPFDRIVELAGVRRDLSRPALVQHLLVYVDAPASSLRAPRRGRRADVMDSDASAFETALVVEDHGSHLRAELQYATALFERAGIERFAAHWAAALEAFAADPDRPHLPRGPRDGRRACARWSVDRTERPGPRRAVRPPAVLAAGARHPARRGDRRSATSVDVLRS